MAAVLADWVMSPASAHARCPSAANIFAMSLVSFLKRTKTSTLAPVSNSRRRSLRRRPRAALGTSSTRCEMVRKTSTSSMRTAVGRSTAATDSVRGDHVAEKSIVKLRLQARRLRAWMSSSKPSSKRRSPSSRTKRLTARRCRAGAGAHGAAPPSLPWRVLVEEGSSPHRARKRPGVATSIEGSSARRCSRCCSWSTPPTTAAQRAPSEAATCTTCWTNSRVGARTKAWGATRPKEATSSPKLRQRATRASSSPPVALAATCARPDAKTTASPDSCSRSKRLNSAEFWPCPAGKDCGKSSRNWTKALASRDAFTERLQRPSAISGSM
mmetsp:Transcript_16000/g.51270  ORF Transcript_16000/g.51270 Transcript_16000/m.51270 type:complete len:327 (+) Transcript_16000:571-1551(+)